MSRILNRAILCVFAGFIAHSSFAVSAVTSLKWNRNFIVTFENTSSKTYQLMTEFQGGVCAHGTVLKGQDVSCDNIPPLKSLYVMYQHQAIGRIVFRPVMRSGSLYFWPHITGVLKNCEVLPPNKVNCQLSDPS